MTLFPYKQLTIYYVNTRDYQGKRVNPPYRFDTGPLTKVIPLNLFLDMVPSSSEDVACALRGQPRLSRNCLRRNGGNVIVVVLISFHSRDIFSAFSRPFVRTGFPLLFTRLAVHYLGAYSILRGLKSSKLYWQRQRVQ